MEDQILLLNGDELYVLLMACMLHDAGMGVSDGEFDEFMGRLAREISMRERKRGTERGSSGTATRNSAPFSSKNTRTFWTCPPRSISLR